MRPSDLLAQTVKKKFPAGSVRVEPTDQGYEVNVSAEQFRGKSAADCQLEVYQALERIPINLIAQISAINCTA